MARREMSIGKWGEEQSCLFLVRQGFTVIERNYYTPTGEIDIVAMKGGDYYFIEVKTRTSPEMANDEAITPRKLYKLNKTVKAYCYRKNITTGAFILAGLLVLANRLTRRVAIRLAVYC